MSDGDTATVAEAGQVAAHVPSADAVGAVDGQLVRAHVSAGETLAVVEGGAAGYGELHTDQAASLAEASSIVASMSDQDTGTGAEGGPAPPATQTGAEAAGVVEASPRTGVRGATETAAAAESGRLAVTNGDSVTTAETFSLDAFGGNEKLGQESGAFAEAATAPPAALSAAGQGGSFSEGQFVTVPDTDDTLYIVETGVRRNVFSADSATVTESAVVVAAIKSVDTMAPTESAPARVVVSFPGLTNQTSQVRDNGITPIDLAEDEPLGVVDSDGTVRVRAADAASFAEARSIVASPPVQSDGLRYVETEQSPEVNLPVGVDPVTVTESATVHATLSAADSGAVVDAYDLDRGTPPSRVFIVEQEVRLKVVPAVTRILEVPPEVRVLVVTGGFR
ncbi:hypothetical protein ACGFZA_15970 [Streptomyces sp. NPDC048211]|uniref:hypothetical protein n=1 Tax=Streptomyces sp. NPDC048211 TaxID=3365516 RepID=UPI003711010E